MTKRAFIVHGWGGYPEEGWFPWLKRQLEEKGFTVAVPAMPNAGHPLRDEWLPALREAISTPDEETYLVGHSLGCQVILHYLQSLTANQMIGGAVLVAPVSGEESITDLINKTEGAHDVLDPWTTYPMDWNTIRSHARSFEAIFSDNDRWIRSDMAPKIKERLGAGVILLHEKSHFSGDDGIIELPEALEAILAMDGQKQ
jgi:uncharacterized protein